MVFATTQSLADTFGATGTLRAQLQSSIQNRLNSKVQTLSDETTSKLSMMGIERAKWETVRSSISEAKPNFESAVTALTSAKSMLTGLKSMLNRANNTSNPTDYKGYSLTFQSYVRSVASSLTSAQGRTPLLAEGNSENNSVTYKISPTGAEQIEFGRDLVPKYTLTTSTDTWKVDRGQNILQRFDGTKNYSGTATSNMAANLTNGIRLDGINGDGTINFTVGAETASPMSYTNATMTSSGLPLKDVWYYDGLSTAEGRERAAKDLAQMQSVLETQIARFQSMNDVADFYDNRAKTAMSELDAKGIAIQDDASKQAKTMQKSVQQEATVLLQAIDSATATQTSYANLLKSATSGSKAGKLFSAIYNVTA